jgi:hypothetical protein
VEEKSGEVWRRTMGVVVAVKGGEGEREREAWRFGVGRCGSGGEV